MTSSKPLDLKKVDPPVWRIFVSDKVYGPFTLGQLRIFILDGRINARSRIAEGNGGKIIAAAECAQLASAFAERLERIQPRSLSNFVIITPYVSDKENLIETLNQMGSFGEVMPGVFLLRSDIRLAQIHGRLSEATGGSEQIMIVDATNDRLAWLGLGADINEQMNAIWNKAA